MQALVLVVDDHVPVRKLVRAALEGEGYRVLSAASGEEAIQIARDCPETIALLVTDFMLERMHGLDVASTLVAERPGLRVLYMSGNMQSVAMSSLMAEARDSVLQKPFVMEELLAKVKALLAPS